MMLLFTSASFKIDWWWVERLCSSTDTWDSKFALGSYYFKAFISLVSLIVWSKVHELAPLYPFLRVSLGYELRLEFFLFEIIEWLTKDDPTISPWASSGKIFSIRLCTQGIERICKMLGRYAGSTVRRAFIIPANSGEYTGGTFW